MCKMQGAKAEAKGSILRYVTEAGCRATQQFVHYDTPPVILGSSI